MEASKIVTIFFTEVFKFFTKNVSMEVSKDIMMLEKVVKTQTI